jgi:hypothetical protein
MSITSISSTSFGSFFLANPLLVKLITRATTCCAIFTICLSVLLTDLKALLSHARSFNLSKTNEVLMEGVPPIYT